MKRNKTGLRFISSLCCAALLLGLLTALSPLAVSADTGTVSLYIEGTGSTVYEGTVALQSGDTAYDLIVRALESKGLTQADPSASTDVDSAQWAGTFFLPNGAYGRYVQRIGIYNGPADYSAYWGVYINGESSSLGISSLKPTAGDTLVLALADASQYLPAATLSTTKPVRGQSVTVQVSAKFTAYDASWNPVVTTQNIAGAKLTLDGSAYTADSSGNAVITMPSSAGDYDLVVQEKDDSSGNAYGIRRVIPIKVSNSTNDTDSGYNLASDDSIDVSATGTVFASLGAVVSGGEKAATLSSDKSITVRSGSTVLKAALSAGTVITGSASWDGNLLLPQVVSNSSVSLPDGDSVLAVQLGASGQSLTLSKPARLVLPGMSGKNAGYIDASGDFHRILTKLSADSAPDNAGSGYTAYYDNGTDLILYTTHFTTFVAYKDTSAVTDAAVASAIQSAGAVLKEKDSSQWAAFALARAGLESGTSYLDELKSAVADESEFQYPATLAKGILTLAANGYDPTDFAGANLAEKLYNFGSIELSGLNGPDYALMALDAANITLPGSAKWTKEKLISAILTYQNSNGSFSLNTTLAGDVDITAITLTALSRHTDDTSVKAAVEKALAWLSSQQNGDGGFTTSNGKTSETVSQVVIALSSLGIDPKTDSRFLKNSKSALDSLMSFSLSSGGFEHTLGAGLDNTASEQAIMALTAYTRFVNSKPALFNLSDATESSAVPAVSSAGSSSSSSSSKDSSSSGSSRASASDTGSASAAAENPQTGSAPVPVAATAAVLCLAAALAPLAKKAIKS